MKEIKQEISKEAFDNYRLMRYSERSKLIKKKIPMEWVLGYGYYGHRLSIYGDKYYLVHTVGDSCD